MMISHIHYPILIIQRSRLTPFMACTKIYMFNTLSPSKIWKGPLCCIALQNVYISHLFFWQLVRKDMRLVCAYTLNGRPGLVGRVRDLSKENKQYVGCLVDASASPWGSRDLGRSHYFGHNTSSGDESCWGLDREIVSFGPPPSPCWIRRPQVYCNFLAFRWQWKRNVKLKQYQPRVPQGGAMVDAHAQCRQETGSRHGGVGSTQEKHKISLWKSQESFLGS